MRSTSIYLDGMIECNLVRSSNVEYSVRLRPIICSEAEWDQTTPPKDCLNLIYWFEMFGRKSNKHIDFPFKNSYTLLTKDAMRWIRFTVCSQLDPHWIASPHRVTLMFFFVCFPIRERFAKVDSCFFCSVFVFITDETLTARELQLNCDAHTV